MAKNLNKACPINEKATATAASSSTSSPSKPHPSQVNLLLTLASDDDKMLFKVPIKPDPTLSQKEYLSLSLRD